MHVNAPDTIGSETPLTLTVSGNAKLVAVVDTESLARDIAGKGKDTTETVLPAHPGIADMIVKVYPFWRSSVPSNAADVKITVTEGEGL